MRQGIQICKATLSFVTMLSLCSVIVLVLLSHLILDIEPSSCSSNFILFILLKPFRVDIVEKNEKANDDNYTNYDNNPHLTLIISWDLIFILIINLS